MKDENPFVRGQAAVELGELKEISAITPLAEAARDTLRIADCNSDDRMSNPYAEAMSAIAVALGRIGRKLAGLMEAGEMSEAEAKSRGREVVEALLYILEYMDPYYCTCQRAGLSLTKVSEFMEEQDKLRLFGLLSHANPENAFGAVVAIGELRLKEARELLVALAKESCSRDWPAVNWAISRIEGKDVESAFDRDPRGY